MSRWSMFGYRSLQAYAVFSALVAIFGGGTFVILGMDGVARVTSVEYPTLAPSLLANAGGLDDAARATFDMWYRALGWYWLTTGLMLLWITPRIAERSAWFRWIYLGFMAVGVANAATILDTGTNIHARYDAVAIELLVPAVAMLWQGYVARSFAAAAAGGV